MHSYRPRHTNSTSRPEKRPRGSDGYSDKRWSPLQLILQAPRHGYDRVASMMKLFQENKISLNANRDVCKLVQKRIPRIDLGRYPYARDITLSISDFVDNKTLCDLFTAGLSAITVYGTYKHLEEHTCDDFFAGKRFTAAHFTCEAEDSTPYTIIYKEWAGPFKPTFTIVSEHIDLECFSQRKGYSGYTEKRNDPLEKVVDTLDRFQMMLDLFSIGEISVRFERSLSIDDLNTTLRDLFVSGLAALKIYDDHEHTEQHTCDDVVADRRFAAAHFVYNEKKYTMMYVEDVDRKPEFNVESGFRNLEHHRRRY